MYVLAQRGRLRSSNQARSALPDLRLDPDTFLFILIASPERKG